MSKTLLLTGLLLMAFACFKHVGKRKTRETREEYAAMKKPAILYYKRKLSFWYGVTLKDANGGLHEFPNSSTFADSLGERYNIGDTIK